MRGVGYNIRYSEFSDIPWNAVLAAELAPLHELVSETRSELYAQTC